MRAADPNPPDPGKPARACARRSDHASLTPMPAKPSSDAGAARIIVVAGTDEGMVRERALGFHRDLTGGIDDGFTHETIDGVSDNSDSAHQICASVVQALQTLPMFGGDKVVWLRNANFLADTITGRAQRTEEGVARLQQVLESGLPDGVRFLLSASAVDKRRSFWKWLEKHAQVVLCDRIDTSRDGWQDQIAAIVIRRANELGLEFDSDALALFVMLAGEQSQQIANELEKLDLFLGPDRRRVTEDDVHALVPLSRAALVFEIGKAIQQGNASRAIQLIDQQLDAGESAVGIMRASVIGVVRNLHLAKLLATTFKPPTGSYQSFAGALNRLPEQDRAWLPQKKDGSGVNVYPIFLCLEQARHFDLDALRQVLESTLKADEALVTTGLNPRVVLHRLIVEIASARRKPAKTGSSK